MMAQKKAGPPPGGGIVKDGLVFHLDGLNRGESVGLWKELVSGKDFTCYNVQEEPDGIRFSGSNNSYASADIDYFSDKGTIQVVFAPNNTNGVIYCPKASENTNCFCFGLTSTAVLAEGNFTNNEAKKALSFKQNWVRNKQYTISAQYNIMYVNGKQESAKSKPDAWGAKPSDLTYIGRRGIGNALPFKLFAIRIYNRQLTEAEILQNQQYDIDTYFGGVTP